MEAWLQDWLSLLLRWAHFITGVAWIGASFYFNWLENHLQRHVGDAAGSAPGAGEPGRSDPIAGDLWAVHGGGFYYLQKFRVAPDRLPEPLHWFKWEAYFTWITGFALLIVVYYWNARFYLLDPERSDLTASAAIALGLASLVVSWFFYHYLCRAAAARHPFATAVALFAWFGLLAFVLSQFLSGRAAYIHVGAAIGTVMVANVYFVIIPAQKELVAALRERRAPEPAPGREALERSRHNNYLTLPVLFLMISNHYPATYGHAQGWLILVLFSLAAVGIRHWFNVRHRPDHGRWVLPASLLLFAALILATLPRSPGGGGEEGEAPVTAAILPVIEARCSGCHAASPTIPGFVEAPLGTVLETAAQIETLAPRIHQFTVATQTMPPGNLTGMTPGERALLARWYSGLQDAYGGNPKKGDSE